MDKEDLLKKIKNINKRKENDFNQNEIYLKVFTILILFLKFILGYLF